MLINLDIKAIICAREALKVICWCIYTYKSIQFFLISNEYFNIFMNSNARAYRFKIFIDKSIAFALVSQIYITSRINTWILLTAHWQHTSVGRKACFHVFIDFMSINCTWQSIDERISKSSNDIFFKSHDIDNICLR